MFGAAIFLTGLAALGVPVAIHFLARQRTRVLPWGAMAFLRQSISSARSRRNRLRDKLLLLLRVLAILLLVLTFAQPLASRRWLGGSDLETVFVWDVSLSTTATGEKGAPVIESMKETLLQEMGRLPNSSQVRILLAGSELRWLRSEALVLSGSNRRSLETSIRQQQADHGGSDLATAVLTAMAVDDRDSARKTRNIVVLHDGRREGWQEDDSIRWQAIHQRLAGNPRLSIRSVAPNEYPGPGTRQLSVAHLEADRDTVALNTSVRFRATLKNHSATTSLMSTVIWRIDQREVERSSAVSVPAGEELKLEQLLTFQESGCHQVECEAELSGDILPADNTLTTVVAVPEGIPVVIVDDTTRTQPGQILPSEFLAAALGSPLQNDGNKADKKLTNDRNSLFSPRVIKSRELTPAVLRENLAVVIANAESLPTAAAGELHHFVAGGGGLWIFMGSTWDEPPAWAADLLKALGLEQLAKARRIVAKDANHLMKIVPSDPAGRFAAGIAAKRLDLQRAELLAVHELDQRAYLDDEKLLQTEKGSPVLLDLAVGAGRVMLQTTDLSRLNTNLPILQSFVPVVRESMLDAIQGALPKRNLSQGEPIQLPLSVSMAPGDQLRIKRPDGSLRDMVLLGNSHESAETMDPGIYQIEQANPNSSQDHPELFSVRRPAAESVLTPISPAAISALIESPTSAPPTAAAEVRQGRWPLAWLFAILTGVCFIAEALLAHWIARQRDAECVSIDLKPVF